MIFVVATFAAGRPSRRASKSVCYFDFGVGSSFVGVGRLTCNVAVMEIRVLERERVLTKVVPVCWGVAFCQPRQREWK